MKSLSFKIKFEDLTANEKHVLNYMKKKPITQGHVFLGQRLKTTLKVLKMILQENAISFKQIRINDANSDSFLKKYNTAEELTVFFKDFITENKCKAIIIDFSEMRIPPHLRKNFQTIVDSIGSLNNDSPAYVYAFFNLDFWLYYRTYEQSQDYDSFDIIEKKIFVILIPFEFAVGSDVFTKSNKHGFLLKDTVTKVDKNGVEFLNATKLKFKGKDKFLFMTGFWESEEEYQAMVDEGIKRKGLFSKITELSLMGIDTEILQQMVETAEKNKNFLLGV